MVNLRRLAGAVVLALSLAMPAAADTVGVSGNPSADGWTAAGNSLADGVFVQVTRRYDFDLYWTSFTVPAGSGLIGGGVQEGDQIIGLGAVGLGYWNTAGDYSAGIKVDDLGQLNAKYGTLTPVGATPLFAPDPDGAGPGVGHGGHSAGNGGVGSVLLSVGSQLSSTSMTNVRLDRTLLHDGTAAVALGTSTDTDYVGRFIADTETVSGTKYLRSFEFFLNNSELQRQGYSPIPLGAGFIVTMHHVSNNNYITDAYGVTATAVPLPAAAWGGMALLAGLGIARLARGRRMAW